MNEQDPLSSDELGRLFQEYSDSLGNPSKIPGSRRSLGPKRWAIATAMVLPIAAIAFAMWPRDAVAARLRRIGQMIKNAQTMEMTFSQQLPSGKWVQFLHRYYSDGMWRSDVWQSTGQAKTIVDRDGLMLADYHLLDHATLGPEPKDSEGSDREDQSALDYALSSRGMSASNEQLSETTRDHADVSGRSTYLIIINNSGTGGQWPWSEHAEILVDKQTGYPISADIIDHRSGENGGEFKYHQEYRFNGPVDPRLFSLSLVKFIVDLRESSARLARLWSHPLAKVESSQIREACVTRDGTIWLAVTTTFRDLLAPLPTSMTADDCEYTRLDDITTGSGESTKVDGQEVIVVGFVPVD